MVMCAATLFYFSIETLTRFDARAITIADLSRDKPKRG